MSAIPCPNKIADCGTDNPIANFSAEAPDPFAYIGMGWSGTTGEPGNDPDIGDTFTSEECIRTCTSEVSQAAADACAQLQGDECQWGQGGGGDAVTNTEQCVSQACGGGLGEFFHCVAAGTITAKTVAEANAIALAQATAEMAQLTALCFLSGAAPDACINQSYFHQMQVTGNDGSLVWSVVGILPAGIALTVSSTPQVATLTGTPTLAGTYGFTVRVARPSGDECIRTYSIRVGGHLSPVALPSGEADSAYSYTLITVGTGYTFAILSGALPAGVTLNTNTGVISGTPTVAGDYTFTIGIER